ncbi:MAG: hypothetical protein H7Y04_10855 [Verrucomicrobia bacterium]|nr:hypothetical protein [Cytophagales bacterium]
MHKSVVISWIFFLGFLCQIISYAQPDPKKQKALQETYNSAKTDSARVMILTEMAWLFRKYDQTKASDYCTQAVVLAQKATYDEGIGFATMAQGNVYHYHSAEDSAIVCYKKAIPLFEKIAYEKVRSFRLGQLFYNLAQVYQQINLNEEAILSLNKSASHYQKSKNIEKLPIIYNDIANIYELQEQYSESLKYADKALQEARRLKDTATFCFVMNDLNTTYLSLHTRTKNAAYLTKAKANFYFTYHLLQKNLKADPDGLILPTIMANLGDCLLREAKYDSAAYFLNTSNRLAANIQYKWVEGYNYMHLGEIALNRGQLAVSDVYFQKALSYRLDYGDSFTLQLYQRLVRLETAKGNFAGALAYQQLYQKDYEKILNAKKNKAINEIQTRYETRKKESQIAELQKDNDYKHKQLIGMIVLAVLGVALAITIFIVYRFQQRIFRQNQKLLREENEKAVLAKKVEEEAKEKALLQQKLAEQENQRIQEEIQLQITIHTLEQQQLQREIDFKQRELTANIMQLEKKNELMIQLKTQLQHIEENVKGLAPQLHAINKLITKSLNIEEDLEKFTAHFENVHPQFFQNLQAHSEVSLSILDMKYCAYIRMQLSTKEIANLLSIEPKSVRMAQYRIKKKLQLSEEDDLKEFLNQL